LKGFTLIEIMVATVITMMIIGSVYAAFRSSLNVYQRDETKIIMLQRCRSALDRMAQDLSNLFYVENDAELEVITQDYSDTETTMDKDMLSFVAIVKPRLDEYLAAEEETASSASEEQKNQLPSDLSRIIYYIDKNPDNEDVDSLMRIETTNLDPQELEEMMTELQSTSSSGSSLSEELQEKLKSSVLVDYVGGLNIRYYDGTDWVDTWDMEEEGSLPRAVELTLTITDADNKGSSLTQATVVHLLFSGVSPAGQATAGSGAQR